VSRATFKFQAAGWAVIGALRRLHTLSLVGLVVVVGLVDYLTSSEVSFSLFYLVPISIAAWFKGLRSGILVAISGAVAWFVSDNASATFTHWLIPYWNVGMRLGVFLLTVILFTELKRFHQDLADKTQSLTLEIAERQRAEEALRENELRFRLITENVADLIMVLDDHGRGLYCNPAARMNRSEASNPDFFNELVPEDAERVQAVLQRTLQTGLGQWADYRVRAHDGSVRYLESHWTVIRETGGKPASVVVVSRDVTERKRSEKGFRDERQILEMIALGKPLPEILQTLSRRVEEWVENLSCSIHIVPPAHLHKTEPGSGPAEPSLIEAPADLSLPLFPGLPGEPARNPAWVRLSRKLAKEGGRLAELRPIISTSGETLGVMAIHLRKEGATYFQENHFIEKAAHIAAMAIERKQVEEALRQISKLVIDAQEAERRRVARELHDGVNQLLSSVAFRIEGIETRLGSGGTLFEEAGRTKFLLTKAIQEVRKISENLLPSELDALGLLPAVRSLLEEIMERSALEIDLTSHRLPKRLAPELELTLFRIIQESLSNIEKHAHATRATVSLTVKDASLHLRIHDNGRGFLESLDIKSGRPRQGMGLVNIRERTAFAGGMAAVRSSPETGTEILVRLPLPTEEHEVRTPNPL
jgi:PAS domain S-box-containing protein